MARWSWSGRDVAGAFAGAAGCRSDVVLDTAGVAAGQVLDVALALVNIKGRVFVRFHRVTLSFPYMGF